MPDYMVKTPAGDVRYTLYRRQKKGRWSTYFHWNGIRYRKTTKKVDLSEARAAAEKEIFRTLHVEKLDISTLLLSEAIKKCLDDRWPDPEKRISNSTYIDARNRYQHFLEWCTDVDLLTVNEHEMRKLVQGFLDHCRTTKSKTKGVLASPQHLLNFQRNLSRLFSWMMGARGLVPWQWNPAGMKAPGVPRLDIPPVRRKPYSAALADEVKVAMTNCAGSRLYPLLVLMQSGLRPRAATRIVWQDVHFGEKPTIKTTEKGEGRQIPLSKWAADELKTWKAVAGIKSDEQRIFPHDISLGHEDLRILRKKHGLSVGCTLQAIRRLSYRRLYEAGVKPQLAAKIMGSSVSTAMKYYVDLETLDAHDAVSALAPSKAKGSTSTKTSTKKPAKKKAGKRKAIKRSMGKT